VKFPDAGSQYTYIVGDFEENIQNRQQEDTIERLLQIEYSALSKGKKYIYESLSQYNLHENRWQEVHEKAS